MGDNLNKKVLSEYEEWFESIKWWRTPPKSQNNGYNKCGMCKHYKETEVNGCSGDDNGLIFAMHLSDGCEFFESILEE